MTIPLIPHQGDEFLKYRTDWSSYTGFAPGPVVFPRSVEEVVELVRWANGNHARLVPSSGRTGLSGGAVASKGEVVVSLGRLNQLLDFSAEDCSLRVQAGVTTQAVQEFASEHGLFYPVDFASRGSSQIGGNVATNAGGIRVLRYGMTREWVTGLTVVTGGGDLLELNRGLTKNATGYDLRHLFIGSEGTLGIVVDATLRFTDPPPPQQVMLLALQDSSVLMEVFLLLRRMLRLSAFEFLTESALKHVVENGGRRPFPIVYPCYVLVEFDFDLDAALSAYTRAAESGLLLDGVLSESTAQAKELWALRERISESIAHRSPYKNDIQERNQCDRLLAM